jgi:hypothetical protein
VETVEELVHVAVQVAAVDVFERGDNKGLVKGPRGRRVFPARPAARPIVPSDSASWWCCRSPTSSAASS